MFTSISHDDAGACWSTATAINRGLARLSSGGVDIFHAERATRLRLSRFLGSPRRATIEAGRGGVFSGWEVAIKKEWLMLVLVTMVECRARVFERRLSRIKARLRGDSQGGRGAGSRTARALGGRSRRRSMSLNGRHGEVALDAWLEGARNERCSKTERVCQEARQPCGQRLFCTPRVSESSR